MKHFLVFLVGAEAQDIKAQKCVTSPDENAMYFYDGQENLVAFFRLCSVIGWRKQ